MKSSAVYDVLFHREHVVDTDAAIIGISKNEWEFVRATASQDEARYKMKKHGIDVLPLTD